MFATRVAKGLECLSQVLAGPYPAPTHVHSPSLVELYYLLAAILPFSGETKCRQLCRPAF